MKKTSSFMKEFREEGEKLKKDLNLYHSPFFHKTYKNIEFCIQEVKSMADQLVEIGKK